MSFFASHVVPKNLRSAAISRFPRIPITFWLCLAALSLLALHATAGRMVSAYSAAAPATSLNNAQPVVIAAAAQTIDANDVIVSPIGLAANRGTLDSPIDLVKALSAQSPARVGSTIWLRGGLYTLAGAPLQNTEESPYRAWVSGQPEAPITIRSYPGEWAVINGGIRADGTDLIFRDFEVTNTAPGRELVRTTGMTVFGKRVKVINLIVHDLGTGIANWQTAEGSEIYGNILYRNGWEGPTDERGNGHGIYTQNSIGTKRVVDNVSFDNYSTGMKAYGQAGPVIGYHFEGNISFNNGSTAKPNKDYNRIDNILIGSNNPAARIVAKNNYLYHPMDTLGFCLRLGHLALANEDAVIQDNYIAGGVQQPLVQITRWKQLTITGNTFVSANYNIALLTPQGQTPGGYIWDYNRHYAPFDHAPFSYAEFISGRGYNWNTWRSEVGLDKNSQWLEGRNNKPAQNQVFVRGNLYEAGRAHIAVFNWQQSASVTLNAEQLSGILRAGDTFTIQNVASLSSPPLLTGTYDGNSIQLPIRGSNSLEFNAFILRRAGALLTLGSPTPTSTPVPTPTPTPVSTPTPMPTPIPTPVSTPTPVPTPTPTPVSTPTPVPKPTVSPTPHPAPTPLPRPTPSPTPTPGPTPAPTPTPTPLTGAEASLSLDAEEAEFVRLLNEHRLARNLNPLTLSISLVKASDWSARDMALREQASSLDSLGRIALQRARDFGYPGVLAPLDEDEIVHAGDATGHRVFGRLLSPIRGRGLPNLPAWKNVGVARFLNASTGRWYWSVFFGAYWDKTIPLAGEDSEGRIAGNEALRTRPPSASLAEGHRFTGYGDDGLPYTPIHCDRDAVTPSCWHDPPPQENLKLSEFSAPENLIGTWYVAYHRFEDGLWHMNLPPWDRASLVIEFEFRANGTWASRGYRLLQIPAPMESGTWRIRHDAARNEEILTLTRQGSLPTAELRIHAASDQLTIFAVDGGAKMKNFLRGWAADNNRTDDPQLIYLPKP